MEAHGQYVAALLRSGRKAYAAGAVLRLSETEPRQVATFGRAGFTDLQNLAAGLIDHLEQSVLVDRSALYEHEVAWLKQVFAARKLELLALRTLLRALRDEFAHELPADAARTAVSHADAALRHFDVAPSMVASPIDEAGPRGEIARRYLAAACQGHRLDAIRIAEDAIAGGMSVPDFYSKVLGRAQVEIGSRWQRGEMNIADEHMSSRITEQVISVVSARMPREPSNGKRVLVTTASGDLHDIGVRMVADHFEMAGWDVLFLGASTPPSDVAQAARERDVDLVAVSAKLVLHVRATAELIEALRGSEGEPKVPILVGGCPFQIVPDLWKIVGADGCASSAREAVVVGETLTARAR